MVRKIIRSNQNGFTLMELMIIAAIIGILMAIAIPIYIQYRTTGADEAARSEAVSFLSTALAEVALTGVGRDFTANNPPQGFPSPADGITIAGTLTIDQNGVLTPSADLEFSATDGATTYTISAQGVVTE